MKLTNLYVKTSKDNPSGEESVNAKLLLRGGFVAKEMAGVYTYLPMGLRVLEKIKTIIREHMDQVSTEIQLPALSPTSRWSDTGRLDEVDVLMKTSGANELSKNKSTNEYILNCTHEDVLTPVVKSMVNSYKDLPVTFYQIQTKFRNEARAKSGLLRGREFWMKDAYSFHLDDEGFQAYYDEMKDVYLSIYADLGLGDDCYLTVASGGDFTEKYSHEFQVTCEAGEDIVYIDDTTRIAYNKEVIDELGLDKSTLRVEKACEVGNIFPLETKFSKALDFTVTDSENTKIHPVMGSYGIGPSRCMGVIVEKYHDEKGIIRPEAVAPFVYCIIAIGEQGLEAGQELYAQMCDTGLDVCLDDRDMGPGAKFKDADLIGYPYQIVIGKKTLEQDQSCELVDRKTDEKKLVKMSELLEIL